MSTDNKLTQELMKVGSPTCSIFGRSLNSRGIWFGDDPLDFSFPLLLLQLSLICIFSRSLHALFKNIDQPSIFSQIVVSLLSLFLLRSIYELLHLLFIVLIYQIYVLYISGLHAGKI